MLKHKIKLLVVDDDKFLLEQIEYSLKSSTNLKIFSASTVTYAVDLLPRVDAVLADCLMPDSARLEGALLSSGKPFFRMSGKVERATNLQLRKPFTKEQLLRAIEYLAFLTSPPNARARNRIAA